MTINITNLVGIPARALLAERRNESIGPVFFKPYKSPKDFIFRTVSVGTAPIIITGFAAYFALESGFELIKGIGNLILLNGSKATEHFEKSDSSLILAGFLLVIAVLSPVINLVDLIVSGVNTMLQDSNDEEEELLPSFN